MSKKIDRIGKTYENITITHFSHTDDKGRAYWIGVCLLCGQTTKPIQSQNLANGHTKSCGCLRAKKGRENAKDISDKVYGSLTAVRPTEKRYRREIRWECRCLCGNMCYPLVKSLESGNTTSCGCRIRSKLHSDTKNALIDLNIEIYAEEYAICQEYFNFDNSITILYVDIMIWSLGEKGLIAIECQGKQHYEPIEFFGGVEGFRRTIERDTKKKCMLKAMGIPLIEIPYYEQNIEVFLKQVLGVK